MDNAKIEVEFLEKLKKSNNVSIINETKERIKDVIDNLKYMEVLDKKGGPDYAYNEYFFEKFSIDSSKREMNKNNKSFSKIKVLNNKIEKSAEYQSEIFDTLTFSENNIRTNIRYMRENLQEMIEQKIKRKERYKKNYSTGKIFGLIIEIEDYCEIYTNDKGEYFSSIDVDTSDLIIEHYEIYRDYNLITKLRKRFSADIDIIIFVEHANFNNVEINCIDLRNEIKIENMKNYPNKILQLCHGTKTIIKALQYNNTNIQYTCHQNIEIIQNEIMIEGNILRITNEPNVYMDNKEMLFYESTQKKLALNPKITEKNFLKYFPILIKENIELNIQDKKYILKRVSPLMSYIHISLINGKGIYRINKYKELRFNFKEI